MPSLFQAPLRYWFFPAPALRLAMLRLLIGLFSLVYLAVQSLRLSSYAHVLPEQFQPVGICSLLTHPLPENILPWIVVITFLLNIAFVLGYRFTLTAPLFALSLLWVLSYRHSWGQIFHSDNLLVIHVAVLAAARSADAWSLDARAAHSPLQSAVSARYGWPIRLMTLATVTVYTISGLAKLRHSGLTWITSDTLRHQVAFDNLRKIELGHIHSPIGVWLLPYRELFIVLACFTMLVELGAPLALLHNRLAKLWALVAWGFHLGIIALMAIVFSYQASGVAYAPIFEVERLEKIPFIRKLLSYLSPPEKSDETSRAIAQSLA